MDVSHSCTREKGKVCTWWVWESNILWSTQMCETQGFQLYIHAVDTHPCSLIHRYNCYSQSLFHNCISAFSKSTTSSCLLFFFFDIYLFGRQSHRERRERENETCVDLLSKWPQGWSHHFFIHTLSSSKGLIVVHCVTSLPLPATPASRVNADSSTSSCTPDAAYC